MYSAGGAVIEFCLPRSLKLRLNGGRAAVFDESDSHRGIMNTVHDGERWLITTGEPPKQVCAYSAFRMLVAGQLSFAVGLISCPQPLKSSQFISLVVAIVLMIPFTATSPPWPRRWSPRCRLIWICPSFFSVIV